MDYMKFCPHCGNGNDYKMPYCIYCGHPLVMGDSLNYQLAQKNFNEYMESHSDEKSKFDQKHFQICANCHRKCPLNMDFCAWCGAKLTHQDQYRNYKFLITTSNIVPGFTYFIMGIVSCTVEVTNDGTDVTKVVQGLKDQCTKQSGNTIIGFHLISSQSKLMAYGTAVARKPLSNR